MLREAGQGISDARMESKRRREVIRAVVRRPKVRTQVDTTGQFAAEVSLEAPTPNIFVSYARSNAEAVRPLVTRLRKEGVTVTWDQDFLGGADFRQEICKAIDAARSVIVVWSSASALSPFVCDEALRALNARKLITTHIAGFNLRDLPLGFGHLNTIPIGDWERVRSSLAEHGFRLRAQLLR
jgi:hypothetical protein